MTTHYSKTTVSKYLGYTIARRETQTSKVGIDGRVRTTTRVSWSAANEAGEYLPLLRPTMRRLKLVKAAIDRDVLRRAEKKDRDILAGVRVV